MPIIDEQGSASILANVTFNVSLQPTGEIQQSAKANVNSSISLIGGVSGNANSSIDTSILISAQGRLNDEANLFGQSVVNTSIVFQSTSSLELIGFANILLSIYVESNTTSQDENIAEFDLVIRLVPQTSPYSGYQNYGARIKIGGVIIPIISVSVNAPENSSGFSIQAEIVKITDKSLFLQNSIIELEIFDSGEWYLFSSSKLSSTNYSVESSNNKPNDKFSFSSISDLDSKLMLYPETPIVIYDSSRITVDAQEIETIFDTDGNDYSTVLIPYNSLTLKKLLDKVFIDYCGFSSVSTNLPNYKLKRVNFDVSNTFFQSVSGAIGMFNPLVFEDSGKIWIIDSTELLPPGFPALETLEISQIEGLTNQTSVSNIEGYRVTYDENDLGDYFTIKQVTSQDEVSNFGDSNYSRVEHLRIIRQYRSLSAPTIVLREVEESSTDTFYAGANIFAIQEEKQVFTFDNLGRQIKSIKTSKSRVPVFPFSGVTDLKLVKREDFQTEYKSHPFFLNKQIIAKNTATVKGDISFDEANPYLGEPFKQDFVKAHLAGNLNEGIVVQTMQPIETRIETFQPVENGQIRVFTTTINYLRNPPIVSRSVSEPRAGEVSLSGQSSKQRKIYVFPLNHVRGKGKIEDLSLGELPPRYGIPLARRRLTKQRNLSGKPQAKYIGLKKGIKRGSTFLLKDRYGNLCNIITTAFSFTISQTAATMNISGEQI